MSWSHNHDDWLRFVVFFALLVYALKIVFVCFLVLSNDEDGCQFWNLVITRKQGKNIFYFFFSMLSRRLAYGLWWYILILPWIIVFFFFVFLIFNFISQKTCDWHEFLWGEGNRSCCHWDEFFKTCKINGRWYEFSKLLQAIVVRVNIFGAKNNGRWDEFSKTSKIDSQ